MNGTYPGLGIIPDEQKKLFGEWDKRFPVELWECKRAALIEGKQNSRNELLVKRCTEQGIGYDELIKEIKVAAELKIASRPPPKYLCIIVKTTLVRKNS